MLNVPKCKNFVPISLRSPCRFATFRHGLDDRNFFAKSMLVSIIITYEGQVAGLADLMARLSHQSYPADQIEIIAVDHGDVESAGSLKTQHPDVQWLFEPGRSAYVARNVAVMLARGDVLAFTEADCLPDENWIQNGVETLTRDGAADAIAGCISLQFKNTGPASVLDWYQHCITSRQEDNIDRDRFAAAANLLMLAETFESVGYFDGRYQLVGDLQWSQRAAREGRRIDYAPDVRVSRLAAHSWREIRSRARIAARESMILDGKNKVSLVGKVWRSLRLFFPDLTAVSKVLQRGGRWSLLRLPGVLFADWMIRIVAGIERMQTGALDFGRGLKRGARKVAPWPRFWARVSRKQVPSSWITGRKSGLIRPESISFTSTGHLLGVCNSEGHSVGIFESIRDGDDLAYRGEPVRIVSNAEYLNYVHDAVLSPCGSFLITVARDAHAFSLFEDPDEDDPGAEQTPLWTFQGDASNLNLPTGAAIHPSGDFIAVANRRQDGITLYQRLDDSNQFGSTPVQRIGEAEMYKHGLSAPHGLDFSPDGRFLVVAHKRFRKWGNVGGGQSAVAIFNWRQGPEPGLNPVPAAMRTYGGDEMHSISVHPDHELIAVTDEAYGVIMLRYTEDRQILDEVARFPVFRVGAGVKGLGFTRSGKQLAVTCDLDEILFFDVPGE
jgi:GT2 family glycosyltransferase